jgi:hypothetical protein
MIDFHSLHVAIVNATQLRFFRSPVVTGVRTSLGTRRTICRAFSD